MTDYLTVAEVYRMQYRLIEMFGGLHGVRDKGAVESAVFRPQIGYYDSIEEEAAALMESLANNYGFLDGKWVYRLIYQAAARYYFDKDLAAFERVRQSLKLLAGSA